MSIKQVFAELEALRTAGVVEDHALGGAVGAVRYIEPAGTPRSDRTRRRTAETPTAGTTNWHQAPDSHKKAAPLSPLTESGAMSSLAAWSSGIGCPR